MGMKESYAAFAVSTVCSGVIGSARRGMTRLIASSAAVLGNALREISTTRRVGSGGAKGIALTRGVAYFGVRAVAGSTEIPMPEVTMLRIVSREFPALPGVGGRTNSWHTSSTWSRKQ